MSQPGRCAGGSTGYSALGRSSLCIRAEDATRVVEPVRREPDARRADRVPSRRTFPATDAGYGPLQRVERCSVTAPIASWLMINLEGSAPVFDLER